MELIEAYVVAYRAGKATPIPNLERAKVWAGKHGTAAHPVRVRHHGKLVYRYPEKK